MKEIKLFVYNVNQCDAKKCTGLKLIRFNLAKNTNKIRGILLNPLAKKILSKEDLLFAKNGITALDCSWEKIEEVFKIGGRRLPFLIASNPTNYGKPYKLSTLEALSSALYILGYKKQAEKILSIYKWGIQFINLNKNLLNDYSKARNEKEIKEIEKLYK